MSNDIAAKAREIADRLDDEAVGGHVEEGFLFITSLAEPIIATALRDARNAALEEAAEVAENRQKEFGRPIMQDREDGLCANEGAVIASRIPSLKGEA